MTDRQTDTARRHMHSIVRQKNENFKIYTDHRDNSDRQLVKRINFHCHVNKNAARIAGHAGRGHMTFVESVKQQNELAVSTALR